MPYVTRRGGGLRSERTDVSSAGSRGGFKLSVGVVSFETGGVDFSLGGSFAVEPSVSILANCPATCVAVSAAWARGLSSCRNPTRKKRLRAIGVESFGSEDGLGIDARPFEA